PSKSGNHPTPGVSSSLTELRVGEKVNVPGPASFPLWPGQMAKIIEGHRLKSNQYLFVRIYDAEAAAKAGPKGLGLAEGEPVGALVIGEERLIKGTEVSFYLPPTGIEVVPDAEGRLVRDAVSLERLEYCVLVGEDGRKSYVRGEAVVFPAPNQRFLERNGQRKFRAFELSEVTGLYVKVIAPYTDDDGTAHAEGEELFITGASKLYFPREEHAIIRYGQEDLHHAIAIPRGEGRYVLNRLTGEVTLVRGPVMFLPDPRKEVITRRVLSDRECALLYPGNQEALEHNRALRRARGEPTEAPRRTVADEPRAKERPATNEDGLQRSRFVPPRTITLETKYEGAVSVDVWTGYAVQVVDRRGGRRVVQGPATVLLEYDEQLEVLSLSTGVPKSHASPLSTVFLRTSGNQVSDRIELVSSDLVRTALSVKYRVRFEGTEPARWFAVDDYVKLLCDHASSLVKAAARRTTIRELRLHVTELVRDALLGEKPGGGPRAGLSFAENAMRVFDVEVLDLLVIDQDVAARLSAAEARAIDSSITLAEREAERTRREQLEAIERALLREAQTTAILRLELERDEHERRHLLEKEKRERAAALAKQEREAALEDATLALGVTERRLAVLSAERTAELTHRRSLQGLELEALDARVRAATAHAEAVGPQLVEALRRLSDDALMSTVAENFGELAAVEGRGLLETARRYLDFAPAHVLPVLRQVSDGAASKPIEIVGDPTTG
ncbi:hypothetical protein L6R52_39035, partial [Myxococcota bacterium]|nr:hypothetical protein [Myxococcota bacterium]